MNPITLTPEQFLTYPLNICKSYEEVLLNRTQKTRSTPAFLIQHLQSLTPAERQIQHEKYLSLKKILNSFILKVRNQQPEFYQSLIFDLIGCTPPEFRRYITNQFQEGMTWENYGKKVWFIRHILPHNVFNLSDPVEVKQYMHYTNLQPCFWKDFYNADKSVYCNLPKVSTV